MGPWLIFNSMKRTLVYLYSAGDCLVHRLTGAQDSHLQTVTIPEAAYTGCPRRNVPDFGRVFPYVKVYRYNPKHLCPKLNGYGDNGQRKVWSSGGSTQCTCQLTSLIDVCPWVWCPIQLTLAVQLCSRLIPECAVSHVTSVLAIQCHV